MDMLFLPSLKFYSSSKMCTAVHHVQYLLVILFNCSTTDERTRPTLEVVIKQFIRFRMIEMKKEEKIMQRGVLNRYSCSDGVQGVVRK